MQKLLDADLIEPSDNHRAYPVVCVTKPNNSIRMCCDYRYLNMDTVDDAYQMTRAQDVILRTMNGRYITSIDCCQCYYQIPMDPDSIPKTAFKTHRGNRLAAC